MTLYYTLNLTYVFLEIYIKKQFFLQFDEIFKHIKKIRQ